MKTDCVGDGVCGHECQLRMERGRVEPAGNVWKFSPVPCYVSLLIYFVVLSVTAITRNSVIDQTGRTCNTHTKKPKTMNLNEVKAASS